ncbi:response regulator transcription factor [Cohnella pontilimi]|uniref:Response regulator transcription factor n=1 Tax=Cohnella pontilimi TaxID=2564100 RepID=A0A4U0F8W4_9BACL|nr:response regulator transcription factor [Cohnella pontilimi]TJY41000.1 response regulator transcription factor [Cohnella pontilimi]
MKQPIRVLIADDHIHAREGMREILSSDPDFVIVGEAASGEEALNLTDSVYPELILMDIQMPGMGGFEAVKAIKAAYPSVKIVMVTVSDDPAYLFEALKKGAQGYLLKNLNPSAWTDYLRQVALDEAPLNPDFALSILREFAGRSRKGPASGDATPLEQLTPREREILREVSGGLTNREVATSLGLSEHTVKNHIKSILQKLHLDNRVQLTRYAYERGLLEPGE